MEGQRKFKLEGAIGISCLRHTYERIHCAGCQQLHIAPGDNGCGWDSEGRSRRAWHV